MHNIEVPQPGLRATFRSFAQRQRNILIAIAGAPLLIFLLGNAQLLVNPWGGGLVAWQTIETMLAVVNVLLFIAIIAACAATKKWSLLWPMLVFSGLPLVFILLNSFHNFLIGVISIDPFYDFSARVIRFVFGLLSTLIFFIRSASIWLTVYLVGRYFKQKNTLEEPTHEHTYPK